VLLLQGLLKGEGKARYGDAWGMWQKQADAFAIDEHAPVRELWYRCGAAAAAAAPAAVVHLQQTALSIYAHVSCCRLEQSVASIWLQRARGGAYCLTGRTCALS
jgi:hypothetical protein